MHCNYRKFEFYCLIENSILILPRSILEKRYNFLFKSFWVVGKFKTLTAFNETNRINFCTVQCNMHKGRLPEIKMTYPWYHFLYQSSGRDQIISTDKKKYFKKTAKPRMNAN
jgi:hypothetical protein